MTGRYDDIIDRPHPVSRRHPQMTMSGRAAQFSSFAALSGYEDAVRETARQTDRRVELSEDAKARPNEKLRFLADLREARPSAAFTCFVPDERKDGGAYVVRTGYIRRIDEFARTVQLTDGTFFSIDDIYEIDSESFRDSDGLFSAPAE